MGVRSYIRGMLEVLDERLTGNTAPSNYEMKRRELGSIAMLSERDDTSPDYETVARMKAGIEAASKER